MTLRALASTDLRENPARVALFLHGYGSNARNLTGLASALPAGMPWASLEAPIPLAPGASAWFHITEPGDPDPAPVGAATDAIWSWVDDVLPPETTLVPIGFSQGGLMATQLLRTRPDRARTAVVLGGFVQAAAQPADALLREERPEVFSGRGEDDRVITTAAVERTDAWLREHATATSRRYPGLAHGIDARMLADVQAFLNPATP
ncbi:alpha/beta hydrolase [Agromyces binzhouensis]|uniref:alpha/beta hydrolase n=1 Tax=Agromyces binzhouensis TaxID=1817495 RepID=UPI00362E12E4